MIRDIVSMIEDDLTRYITDAYLMQREEYVYEFAGRGLINHPGKMEMIANDIKRILQGGGYQYTVEVLNDYSFRAVIKIPERYTN
jgi:hypothetical protein